MDVGPSRKSRNPLGDRGRDRHSIGVLARMVPADARTGIDRGEVPAPRDRRAYWRHGRRLPRGARLHPGKEVAVKILHEGYGGREESIKRFLREARAASLINHPNIVDVTDFGKSSDGTVFFVMELLEGEALDIVLQRDRRLDLMRAITIVNQMAGALGSAHSKGIVHNTRPQARERHAPSGARAAPRAAAPVRRRRRHAHGERAREGVRLREDPRLRRRQGARPRRQRRARHTAGRRLRDARVHGARDGARQRHLRSARTDIYALGIMFYEMLHGHPCHSRARRRSTSC